MTPEPTVSMAAAADTSLPDQTRLVLTAWAATLAISALPDIVFDMVAGAVPGWLTNVKVGLLVALVFTAAVWRPLRPLRNYGLAMLALFGLSELRVRLSFEWPLLQTAFGNTVFDARMQAEQTGKLMVTLAMVLFLLALGYRRRAIYLTRGAITAPIQPVWWLGFPKPDPWPRFGLQWGIYIALALAIVLYLGVQPPPAVISQALPVLPSILFYATLNAFNEEITYRASILTTLEAAIGTRQAWALSAYLFGIAHYFGTPGGVGGAIAATFMGWLLSKAMLETRGLFWAWWIHFLSDVAIFAVMTLVLLS